MPSALLTPPPPSAIPAPSSRAQLAPSPEHTPGGSIPGRGEGGGVGGYRSNRHPCATSHPTAQRASIGRTPLNAPVHPPARMTRAPRTPPPGATGANLSALQPTPKPTHTPTTDKPSAARTRTHSRTAATITTNRHSTNHHDTPKPATTTKHQHTKTRAQPQQRDQHTTL